MTKSSQELAYNYFMETDISKYAGEWIAVAENRILAHGRNLKEVVERAKTLSGGKKFIIARVPSEETMIF
ncbi:MAG: DUF5678 domain-containing protein [Nanoarchaeota archaeon]